MTRTTTRPNVVGHTYDPETQTLSVTFHQGATYDYQGVTPADVAKFEEAGAGGRGPHRFIIPNFQGIAS